MDNLTESINSGKSDWANMQKKLLKENVFIIQQPQPAADPLKEVDQMGGSNIPASAPAPGAGGDTTEDLRDLVKSNIKSLANNKEFKKFINKQQMMVSKEEADYVYNVITKMKPVEYNKDNSPFYKQLDDVVGALENDILKQNKNVENNINEFNRWSDEAVKQHRRGLGVQYRSFPTIKNLKDFKEVSKFFSGQSPHVLQYLLPEVNGETFNVLEENVNEAEVPNVLSTTQNDPGVRPVDPSAIKNLVNPETAPEEVRKFTQWLSNNEAMGKPKKAKMIQLLTNVLNSIKAIEMDNVKIQAFNTLYNKGLELGIQGAKGAAKTNSGININDEKEKQRIEDAARKLFPQTNVPQEPESVPSPTKVTEAPTGAYMQESAEQRIKHGPGKIFDVNANPTENLETSDDIQKKKLKNINEGWKKYAEKKTPNKQKPDDFTLLMG